jgi:twinkle protein
MPSPDYFADLTHPSPLAVHPPKPPPTNPADALLNPDDVLAEMRTAWDRQDTNGSPTHFPTLQGWWSWMPGEATLVTGWPGHGKTEFMLQLMLTKSVYDDWRWGLDCPENMPSWKLVRKLVQAYVGQTCNPKYRRLSFAEYEAAAAWVLEHFFIVNPRKAGRLDEVLAVMRHAALTHQTHGFLFDPWNTLTDNLRDYGGRDDEMLKHQLGALCDFAEDYNQCAVVCAHPAGVARTADGKLKVPDQFSVAQGRMWANKIDNLLVLHRPHYDENPADNAVAFHAKKVKEQPETGFPTPADGVTLSYDRSTFRYRDPKLGDGEHGGSPLDVAAINRYRKHGTNCKDEIIRHSQQVGHDTIPTDMLPSGARLIRLPYNN